MKATAALRAADRNPCSWNMVFRCCGRAPLPQHPRPN